MIIDVAHGIRVDVLAGVNSILLKVMTGLELTTPTSFEEWLRLCCAGFLSG